MFFQQVNHIIATSHGNQRQEMLKVKDAATKWFTNPLVACFEGSEFLFRLLDGSVKFVRERSDRQAPVAGGCGITVEDMEAQGSTWLGYFHRGISVRTTYADMEIKEGDDPEAIAKGYLYTPLSDHPFDNHVLNALQAITNEDLALFEKDCEKTKEIFKMLRMSISPIGETPFKIQVPQQATKLRKILICSKNLIF